MGHRHGHDAVAPSDSRVWYALAGDVRNDETVAAEVATWLASHRVKQTTSYDRIIGCPHQEGIDYPMGRVCPQCPFWAHIDRFTHEPVVPPEATMTADEVLAELMADRPVQPLDALVSADAHREALVEPLLQAMASALADPKGTSDPQAALFSYALYLLAKWREPRAYPLVVGWLSLPGDGAQLLAGDVVTQDGGRILAAVCDGNLGPISTLILNRDADEFCRGMGVAALARLAAWGEVARDIVVAELLWLAREGLEREPSNVWSSLAADCADIEALEVFSEIRRAYAEGLVDPFVMAEEELDEVEAGPRWSWLERDRRDHPPIDDVARATSWWAAFHPASGHHAEELALAAASGAGETFEHTARIDPYHAPPKVGRNAPCPCGSGKKYKKCCGG